MNLTKEDLKVLRRASQSPDGCAATTTGRAKRLAKAGLVTDLGDVVAYGRKLREVMITPSGRKAL